MATSAPARATRRPGWRRIPAPLLVLFAVLVAVAVVARMPWILIAVGAWFLLSRGATAERALTTAGRRGVSTRLAVGWKGHCRSTKPGGVPHDRPPTSSPRCIHARRWTLIVVLLAPAVVLPLLVPLYDSEDPTLFGFPFYFWFQLALIPVAVVLTVIAYYLAKAATRPRPGGEAMSDVSTVAFSVFLFFFLLVTVLGFVAARWRRAADMGSLDEWGLGGRGFGTFIAWFLIGGDLYTAYTFIAVPALLYAGSAIGFFAVPYTIVVYPLIFLFLPRLWSVSHRHGYVTPADFVEGRYDSRPLALAVALTGILATMPYIALQLVGIEVVLEVMGIGTDDANWFVKDLPLFIAFAVLAAYTYSSGLRAPALIAFVKDTLIYIVIIVAVIYLPTQLGGWDDIFSTATDSFDHVQRRPTPTPSRPARPRPRATIPAPLLHWAYASLALGSALALFMYPHSVTAVLSTRDRSVIRRNAALLPAYSFLLGLLALLGFVAIAAGVQVTNPQQAVPQLFENEFPDWFAGVAFAAIVIGALVPAAIMSIAAANLWTRNIYKAFINRDATHRPGGAAEQGRLAAGEVRRAGCSCCSCPRPTPSTSSCSAASGSCRPSRRSWSASTPGGSTGGRCSPAGRSAWSTARWSPTATPRSATPAATSAARSTSSRSPTPSSTSASRRSC